tara:strand:+ start:994 stop:1455 length:462 start_codon:yes stop_codon:yes gene_type:complete
LFKPVEPTTFGKSIQSGKMAQLNENIVEEFRFQTSRSSGKGGQNVNKVETRVELFFDVVHSAYLTDQEKERILEKLANQINKNGEFYVANEDARTQQTNKKRVIAKALKKLEGALKVAKPRKTTNPSKAQKEKRLKAKKVQSDKKQSRKKDFY